MDTLPVMEEFYSLQGEGYHTGEAAYFIRVGGCDVGCYFCDSKAAWDASAQKPTPLDDLVRRAVSMPSKTVILTGGEPMLYNLDELCRQLKKQGIFTYLETSGSQPLSGQWDWICLSPKEGHPVLPGYREQAGELKMIICHEHDFGRAEEEAARVNKGCRLYLQAEWSQRKTLTPLVVEYIKEHPQWRLSQQTHKYIDIR
ncbi:MAG: 7-carboxy-7-deazaguanine synthase QueE [Bacteroidales bacterium]|nr:7-carboxy-7-deazaguanine synthase QueE [Bacteroidales bacterium]